jgi:ubiquinone/menaquinone biosynthesis C-methylase UbiE
MHFSPDYLDAVRSVPAVQTLKERSFQLLELPADARVLDVGCGTGEDVLALAEIVGPGGEAVGVDHSPDMIGEARRRSTASPLPVTFRLGDVYHLEFGDDTFHGVRTERLLHFLDRPVDALAEMLRVARPGGWIVVCEPDWETLVVDGPDPAITRRLVSFAFQQAAHYAIGRSIPNVLRSLGLESVSGTTETLDIADPAIAMRLFRLREMVFAALISGSITSRQAATWLLDLERSRKQAGFTASLTGSIVRGRKPRNLSRWGATGSSQILHDSDKCEPHKGNGEQPAKRPGRSRG